MKLLTVTREQFRQQKEAMAVCIKERDAEIDRLSKKLKDMTKLVDSMCVAQKSLNHNESAPADQAAALDKARDDIERAERIAKSTNKSSFMALGDK
jgi:multidrug resistance efflux pump